MNGGLALGAAGLALFGIGLHALFFRPHLVHKVVAANVAASGTFLILVQRPAQAAPDPVAQALVLTGIVVSVALTGFAAALAGRLHAASGRSELDGDEE
jgi:multicomponent Na+:H+ antiporter subunit C